MVARLCFCLRWNPPSTKVAPEFSAISVVPEPAHVHIHHAKPDVHQTRDSLFLQVHGIAGRQETCTQKIDVDADASVSTACVSKAPSSVLDASVESQSSTRKSSPVPLGAVNDSDSVGEANTERHVGRYVVELTRASSRQRWGFAWEPQPLDKEQRRILNRVVPGSAAHQWCLQHPEAALCKGDVLMKVNEREGEIETITIELCRNHVVCEFQRSVLADAQSLGHVRTGADLDQAAAAPISELAKLDVPVASFSQPAISPADLKEQTTADPTASSTWPYVSPPSTVVSQTPTAATVASISSHVDVHSASLTRAKLSEPPAAWSSSHIATPQLDLDLLEAASPAAAVDSSKFNGPDSTAQATDSLDFGFEAGPETESQQRPVGHDHVECASPRNGPQLNAVPFPSSILVASAAIDRSLSESELPAEETNQSLSHEIATITSKCPDDCSGFQADKFSATGPDSGPETPSPEESLQASPTPPAANSDSIAATNFQGGIEYSVMVSAPECTEESITCLAVEMSQTPTQVHQPISRAAKAAPLPPLNLRNHRKMDPSMPQGLLAPISP